MEQEFKIRGAPVGEEPKSPIHKAIHKQRQAKEKPEPKQEEPVQIEQESSVEEHNEPPHRVAVVTGASSGIGKAVALHLASSNFDLMLVARNKEALKEVQAELAKYRVKVIIRECDVTKIVQVHETINHAAKAFGHINVLVNCAGYGVYGPIETMRLEDINGQMLTNYFGSVLFIKESLAHLKETKGVIVNIASIAGLVGVPQMAAYSASKHAIVGLSESLRWELSNTGVAVCCVCPGKVDTKFFENESFKDVAYAQDKGIMPSDVARVVDKAIHERKALYTVPSYHKLELFMGRLLPESWIRKQVKSKMKQDL